MRKSEIDYSKLWKYMIFVQKINYTYGSIYMLHIKIWLNTFLYIIFSLIPFRFLSISLRTPTTYQTIKKKTKLSYIYYSVLFFMWHNGNIVILFIRGKCRVRNLAWWDGSRGGATTESLTHLLLSHLSFSIWNFFFQNYWRKHKTLKLSS